MRIAKVHRRNEKTIGITESRYQIGIICIESIRLWSVQLSIFKSNTCETWQAIRIRFADIYLIREDKWNNIEQIED